MRFSIILNSENRKTGPIIQTYSSNDTCPPSCPLIGKGCYAAVGFTNFTWRRTNKSGLNFNQFTKEINKLSNQLVRHNIAGDNPGKNDKIDKTKLKKLTKAFTSNNKKSFSYTHYPVWNHKHAKNNREAIKLANKKGFTINLSANNLKQADKYKKLNIAPVVCIVPKGTARSLITSGGNKAVLCPAQYREGVTCQSCQLCQKQRGAVVMFESHGIMAKTVDKITQTL